MAAEQGLSTDIGTANSIDFVNQFNAGIGTLRDLLGITRLTAMNAGTQVKVYEGSVTLAGGEVDEGDIIPLSEVSYEVADTYTLAPDKRRKAVPVETIMEVGFDLAITKTDDLLKGEIINQIKSAFFTQLASGTGAVTGSNFQEVMARAYAGVNIAFEGIDTASVAVVHPNDVADYLGSHQITLESERGINYLRNFLGFNTVIVTAGVDQGTIYATASQNLNLAYARIDGDIQRAFPGFVVDPDVPMLGVLHDTQHDRLTSETVTLFSIVLFAERLNGVVVGTIGDASI